MTLKVNNWILLKEKSLDSECLFHTVVFFKTIIELFMKIKSVIYMYFIKYKMLYISLDSVCEHT